MKKNHYVYLITNLINGKQYIGDRTCIGDPKNDKYMGSGRPILKNAKNKYKLENFKKEILEIFDNRLDAFNSQEKYIIKFNTLYPNGYNISPKGGHFLKGSMSEETKKKIGEANKKTLKGRKLSEETIEKIRKSNTGKKRSEDQRKKMSEAQSKIQKEIQNRADVREKKKIAMTGILHTEESKIKISLNNSKFKYWKNKKFSDDHKLKISQGNIGKTVWNDGKKLSDSHKLKIGESIKGSKCSEETKIKMSMSSKGKPKSDDHKKKCGLANLGKKSPKIYCEHCKKEYANYMYKLYHGENCKKKNI